MSAKDQRNHRDKLFLKHPYCSFCGCELISAARGRKMKPNPPNMATLFHAHTRLDPERKTSHHPSNRTKLACFKCNNERGSREQAALPIWELWKRSGRIPQMDDEAERRIKEQEKNCV